MAIPKSDTRKCVACAQPIVFAVVGQVRKRAAPSQNGPKVEDKLTALDPGPNAAGNFTLTKVGDTYQATKITRAAQLAGLRAAGHPLHQSHALTCPKHDEFIRTRRGVRP